jgi:hypothetical protein
MLTDQADVSVEIVDAASGRALATRPQGVMAAGVHRVELADADLRAAAGAGDPCVRVAATSGYPGAATAIADAHLGGGTVIAPDQPLLLGNLPNPVASATRIVFLLPAGPPDRVALSVFDAGGRRVRALPARFAAGRNEVLWDGADDRGRPVPGGVYFYRLSVGDRLFSRRMVVVR